MLTLIFIGKSAGGDIALVKQSESVPHMYS